MHPPLLLQVFGIALNQADIRTMLKKNEFATVVGDVVVAERTMQRMQKAWLGWRCHLDAHGRLPAGSRQHMQPPLGV